MKGLSALCDNPIVYNTFQYLSGSKKARKIVVDKYIKPMAGNRILDIGCGTGSILLFLPGDIEYVGFDPLQSCVDFCNNAGYGRGEFYCDSIETTSRSYDSLFDVVIATGVVHHLDDDAARKLFEYSYGALKPGGKLITVDGAFYDEQSKLARWVVSRDRGQYIRTPEEYMKLAKSTFYTVEDELLTNFLRIPYTHFIMTCVK